MKTRGGFEGVRRMRLVLVLVLAGGLCDLAASVRAGGGPNLWLLRPHRMAAAS